MANGFSSSSRRRGGRQALHRRRHEQHAADGLVDPGGDVVWRDDGFRRLQHETDHPVIDRVKSVGGTIATVMFTSIGLQHCRRRPVYRDRAAGAHVHARISQARPASGDTGNRGRKLGHGDLAADPVELVRRLYDGRAGRIDLCLLSVLFLQLSQPDLGSDLWICRHQRAAPGAGRTPANAAQRSRPLVAQHK